MVAVGHLHGHTGRALQRGQDVKAPTPPRAPLVVARVGEPLQLGEDEARDDQGALEKARPADVHEPAVDEGGGVHELGQRLQAALGVVDASEREASEDAAAHVAARGSEQDHGQQPALRGPAQVPERLEERQLEGSDRREHHDREAGRAR